MILSPAPCVGQALRLPSVPLLALLALFALALTLTPLTRAQSPALQPLVDRAVATAVEKFAAKKLTPAQLAVTVLDLSASAPTSLSSPPAAFPQASHRGDVLIYPASVIKLFYLAAAHRWMEDVQLTDTPELRRAMKDMIVDSSNDATHYVIDLLTGTTSGPELAPAEIAVWFDRRNAVTRHFTSLGYTGVIAHKKPWGDGPYGRESQATRLFEPKRNMLTTEATARLLADIATGRSVTPARSAEMMTLLARDPAAKESDPDSQARFTGPVLPPGSKLWSKAGWTSQTRHDAAYVELPSGKKLILVIFTTDHARERTLIHTVAKVIVDEFAR